MAVTKVNAENWTVEILTTAPDTYTTIKGLEDFDISRNVTRADTTDFESEGAEENRVIRRGKTITLNGHYLEDESDGSRDPGQEALEGATEEVGAAAEKTIKMTSPGGTVFTFNATVQVGTSGNKNDVTKFAYELVRTGATTKTAGSGS